MSAAALHAVALQQPDETARQSATERPPGVVWLFSPLLDVLAFAAPAGLSLLLCAVLALRGGLDVPLSSAGWLLLVVLVDVAHVYSTIYRVYADPAELRRRPLLYAAVPVVCYALGLCAYAVSWMTFWRCLAYLAVWHFVRQQYGWIALTGRRDRRLPQASAAGPPTGLFRSISYGPYGRFARFDRWLDGATVYAGTLYPLLWWHTHLPRRFNWFVAGDFADRVPHGLLTVATPLWAALGLLWLARQVGRGLSGGGWNATKLLVMIGTWATWYGGIVLCDSDVAFTLTNVLTHGVPYLVVVWMVHVRRQARPARGPVGGPMTGRAALPRGAALGVSLLAFYVPLVVAAFLEEGVWDRLVWHEHADLFPLPALVPGAGVLLFLVPLLALPQSTHYLLDAWIWRSGKSNPDLARRLGLD